MGVKFTDQIDIYYGPLQMMHNVDGAGGGFSEFAMLSLRLTEGLQRKICETRFENGGALFDGVLEGCKHLPKNLIHADYERISLTAEGFLVSNAILAEILPG